MKLPQQASVDVLEGDKTIAEFMGCYGSALWAGGEEVYRWGFKDTHITERWHESDFIDQTPYHSSWDWLLPCVEKIQSIDIIPSPNYRGYRIEIVVQGYVKIEGFPMPTIFRNVSVEGSLIKAVWLAVVDFITFYNTQTKKQ